MLSSVIKLLDQVVSQLGECNLRLETLPLVITADPANCITAICTEVTRHVIECPHHAPPAQVDNKVFEEGKHTARGMLSSITPFEGEKSVLDHAIRNQYKDKKGLEDAKELKNSEDSDDGKTAPNAYYLHDLREHIGL